MTRIDQIVELLKEDPNDSFLNFALAKEFEKAEEDIKAIETYTNLLKLDPEYAGLYYHLGKIYEKTGNEAKALNIYDQGIEICTQLNDLHALSELKNAKTNCELGI